MKEFRTFGDWRKLYNAISIEKNRYIAAAAFIGALDCLNRSLPCTDRGFNSLLTEKETADIEECLRIGIGLGVLPIKVPDTWGQYLSMTNIAGCKLNRERRGPKADFAEILEGELKATLSRIIRGKIKLSRPNRKKKLHDLHEDLPVLVEEALRNLAFRGYFDPMKILDLKLKP